MGAPFLFNFGRFNFGPKGGRTQFAGLAVDASTASTVLAPLLSLTATNGPGRELLIGFTASTEGTTATTTVRFQLLIDGVPTVATADLVIAGGALLGSAALSFRTTGLPSGAHTIAIEWAKLFGFGVVSIEAVTTPGTQHASLWTQEVAP